MKKKICITLLLISLLTTSIAPIIQASPLHQEIGQEMIKNGDMSDGFNNWGYYKEGSASEYIVEDGLMTVAIENAGKKEWAAQPFQDGLLLTENSKYVIKVDLWSTIEREAKIRLQQNGGTYTGYLEEQVTLTTSPTTYEYEFSMYYESDPSARLVLNFGQFEDDDTLPPHEVYIDNVSLILLEEGSEYVNELDNLPSIRVNQVGYLRDAQKVVLFADLDPAITTFDVIDYQGNVVFIGNIIGEAYNEASEETIRTGDFSEITKAGSYRIQVGDEKSGPFRISNGAYNALSDALLKMFAYQRSGVELDWMLFGDHAHPAGYLEPVRIYNTDTYIDVSGGWADAGDYGRYITPASKAIIDLFLAYERSPEAYTDDTEIPEAGNGIPDILDEIKIELDWFLKMQDMQSGGVHHKATTAYFAPTIWPQENEEEVIVTPISAQATADFAAVMAKAAIVYQEIYPDFAAQSLQRAKLAWTWLEANPDVQIVDNPEGITTGAYDDTNSNDERLWAAVELYAATGDETYHNFIKASDFYTGFGWAEMGDYAITAYLSLPEEKQDHFVKNAYLESFIERADQIVTQSNQDLYGSSLTHYPWGSNMTLANNANHLLMAMQWHPSPAYEPTALQHLHYLLGQNAVAKSFVTGYGYRSVKHPHHRISMLVGDPVPGMLIGGPNQDIEDPYSQTMLTGYPPQKTFVDNDQSYSTNEVTIYWNSPMLYLVDYFAK